MKVKLGVTVAMLTMLTACTATVDKRSVQATHGAPVSAQVEPVRIPHDAAQPMYVVTVRPLDPGTGSGGGVTQNPTRQTYSWGPWGWRLPGPAPTAPGAYTPHPQGVSDRIGKGIAAQLTSALGNAGNLVVIDYEHYQKNRRNPRALLRKGEVGPFLIQGMVTEFSEVAEAGADRKGGSLGWVGTVVSIVGAALGVPGVGIAGAAVLAANPTWENAKARRTGMVGMDLQVVAPRSGRLVGSIVSHGKFVAESETNGFSVFDVGGGQSAFAASALGQATRVALNDAVKKLTDQLRVKGTTYARRPR